MSLKYRTDAKEEASAKDQTPRDGEEPDTKFEADILLKPAQLGETEATLSTKYSNRGSAEFPAARSFDSVTEMATVFPALSGWAGAPVSQVRSFVAHETTHEGGKIELGPGCEAEASFTLWWKGSDHPGIAFASGAMKLVEFSFKYKLADAGSGHAEIYAAAQRFFKKLSGPEWMEAEAKTKTQIVYG